MAGHNKWSKIKRTKGVADQKRGKLFTKLLREIQIATRLGGADPKGNPRLRDAIAEARDNNMPKDNIERAIKRGSGELDGSNYEEITYEGYGPGGAALLIESLTDNRNRTVAEIRFSMTRNGGSLAESGSVGWMFKKKGQIFIPKTAAPEDVLTDLTLEAGAEDLVDDGDSWEVLVSPENYLSAKSFFESKGIVLSSAKLTFTPQNTIELTGEAAQQAIELVDALEDLDDVQKVHSNFDISDEELARIQL